MRLVLGQRLTSRCSRYQVISRLTVGLHQNVGPLLRDSQERTVWVLPSYQLGLSQIESELDNSPILAQNPARWSLRQLKNGLVFILQRSYVCSST